MVQAQALAEPGFSLLSRMHRRKQPGLPAAAAAAKAWAAAVTAPPAPCKEEGKGVSPSAKARVLKPF